ncbi:MAG TPA: DUF4124 domain-containing protein [Chromatiales bacterium]|nr:DUF4124 domain-containing protein [Chromatiales bacterium]
MRRLLVVLLLVAGFASVASSAEVYRWVDDSGQVHYSDRPREGAERVDIGSAQAIETRVPERPGTAAKETEGEDEKPFRYRKLEIVKPAQEEVLWNIGGELDVSLQLQPRLQTGHRIELFLDGKPVEVPNQGRSLQAHATEVFRGVHVLTAVVRDRNDRTLIESEPRTFAVQQNSILNPNNPNNAPPPVQPGPVGSP